MTASERRANHEHGQSDATGPVVVELAHGQREWSVARRFPKATVELDDGVPAPPLSVKILNEMPLKLGDRRDCPVASAMGAQAIGVQAIPAIFLIGLDGKIATKIFVASRSRTRDDLPPLGQHLIECQVADDRIDLVVRSRRESAEDTVGGDSVSRCWRAKAWSPGSAQPSWTPSHPPRSRRYRSMGQSPSR